MYTIWFEIGGPDRAFHVTCDHLTDARLIWDALARRFYMRSKRP